MSIEEFKRVAKLRQRSEELASELQEKSTARTQAVLDDFRARAVRFLEENGFDVQHVHDQLHATYAGSILDIELPQADKPLIGAFAIVELTLNKRARSRLALVPPVSPPLTQRVFVKQPTEAERLENDIAGLEAAIAKYNVAAIYTVQYFVNKPQPSPQEAKGVMFNTPEEAITAVLQSGG